MKAFSGTYIIMMIFGLIVGCSQQNDFSSPSCVNGNANCTSASTIVAFQSGDSTSAAASVDNNGNLGSLKIKTVRYGEQWLIEFIVTNPKLSPLSFSSKTITPGDSSFTDGIAKSAKDCTNSTILYSQSCSIAFYYKPNDPPPAAQTLILKFKTFLGDDFVINSGFDANALLADFYIDPLKLKLPDTTVYNASAGSPVIFHFNLENHGQDSAGTPLILPGISYALKPGSACTLSDGATNPCGSVTDLAGAGGSCELTMTYKPTTLGLQRCDLVVSSTNGASRTYSFQGTSWGWQSSNANVDFGTSVDTTPQVKTLSVTLPTNATTNASSCSFNAITGTNASQYSVTPGASCTSSVAGGTTCNLNVQWTPPASASESQAQLKISCDTRGGDYTFNLHGRKVSSKLITSSNQLSWPSSLVGTSSIQSVVFTNTDSTDLTHFAVHLSNITGSSFAIQSSSTCGTTLPAGTSCQVDVKFNASFAGTQSASLIASSTEATMDSNVALVGEGLQLQATPSSYDFGAVVPGTDRPGSSILISNPTNTTVSGCQLVTTSLAVQGFSIDVDSECNSKTSLASGETCEIKPRFFPKTSVGLRQASFQYTCSSGGTVSITLSGESKADLRLVTVPPARAALSNRLVGITQDIEFILADFDSTQDVADLSVALNTPVTGWSVVSAGSSDCANLAGGTLPHGSQCKAKLRFNPLATAGSEQAGSFSGSLNISSSDSSVVVPTINFASEAKTIQSSVSSYDMGTILTGVDVSSKTFVFTNPSDVDDASGCALSASGSFTVINSTCVDTLPKSSSCSAQVKLPAQSSSAQYAENLDYTCSVGGRSRIALQAYVQKPPTLTWSGTSDFSYVDIGQTQTTTLTLTHTGAPLDNSAQALLASLTNIPEFQITANNCPTVLTAGSSCNVNVTWTPTVTGARSATLSASGNNFATLTQSLFGNAIDPNSRLTPSPSSVSFLGHLVGSHTEQVITFTNAAVNGTSASLSTGSLSQGVPWTLSNDSCNGNSLATSANCTVKLNYDPTVVASTTGQFTMTAGAISKTISYAGSSEIITNSVSSVYDFGDVDLGAAITSPAIVITNPSSLDDATGCNYTVDSPFTLDGSSTCASAITKGTTCNLKVTLPSQSSGITITGKKAAVDCAVGGHTEIALSADVKEIPKMVWTGTNIFGEEDINQSGISQTFTLTNPKAYAIDLTSLALVGSDTSFAITGGTCTASSHLPSSGSCTVDVKFAPTSTGSKTIILSAGAALPNPYKTQITLTGTATQMTLALSATSLSFGPVELGYSGMKESQAITITNNGNRTTHLTFTGLTNPPFAVDSGSCATIPAGGTCVINGQSFANNSTGTYNQTLTLTETLNDHTTTKTVTFNGQTVPVAGLALKDNRAQSTYVTTIPSTDITGPTDDANNIINLSPTHRSVTFTVQSTASGAGDIDTFAITLTNQSGTNNTMTVVNDTCTGSTLSALGTCTFDVDYAPTTNNETSTYSVSVTAISKLSGNTLTVGVTSLIAHSIRGVSLAASSTALSFGPTKINTSATSVTVTLTNNGDQTATSLNVGSLTGAYTSLFSLTSNSCGTSLAGQTSCTFAVTFTPSSTIGAFAVNLGVSSTQQTMNSAVALKAASYSENPAAADVKFGLEPDITFDGTFYYMASRYVDTSTSISMPAITVCDTTTEGGTNVCHANEIYDGTRSYLAGTTDGSGPRIVQSGNKIFVALQDQENDSSSTNYGDSAVLVCMKPSTASQVLTLADCAVLKPHTSANINESGLGLYSSMAISGSQIAIGNQTHHGYIITVCTIDTTGTDPSTGIDVNSCKASENSSLADSDAAYTAIAFNGTQLVFASFSKSSTRALMGVACSVDGSNNLTCSGNTTIDSTSTTIGSDTFEPGVYPSIVLDGTKFYIAHQSGENIFKILKLSTCDLSTATSFSCSTQIAAQSSDSTGFGLFPNISISGSGPTARLWISYTVTGDYGSAFTSPRYALLSCSASATTPTCSSPYFTQATSSYPAHVYARRSYLNTTSKIMVIPYTATSQRMGVANIGLIPEL